MDYYELGTVDPVKQKGQWFLQKEIAGRMWIWEAVHALFLTLSAPEVEAQLRFLRMGVSMAHIIFLSNHVSRTTNSILKEPFSVSFL